MRKNIKRIFSIALCIAMCLSLCVFSNAADPELQLVLNKDSVNAGENLSMTIQTSESMNSASFGGEVSVSDSAIAISAFNEEDRELTASNVTTGRFARTTGTDRATQAWVTVVFSVPADMASGTYTITFDQVSCATASGTKYFEGAVKTAEFTVIGVEPDPTAEYTVTAAADADEVEVGETVVVDVTVSGAAFNGMEAELNFDASLFELVSVDGIAAADNTATSGVVELYAAFNNVAYATGTKVASVTFEAIAEGTAQFTFGDATAGDYEDYRTDAVQATKVGDSVKVNPKTYTITVNAAANGTVTPNKTEAAAGETITLSVVPAADYELDTLTVSGVETTKVNNSTYTFVMPAADVTVTATFKAKAVEDPWDDIAVKNDYVSGVTLVTVTGDSAKGYTYDGKAMYKVADGKFAYLVEGTGDTSKVAEAASAGYVDLSGAMANDVNGTNKVDFNDAGAAFGCYNKAYDVVADMAMYLRADVNGDGIVDGSDVNVILGAY